MMIQSWELSGCLGNSFHLRQKLWLFVACLVVLLASAGSGPLHAGESIEVWRKELDSTRKTVETSPPVAYGKAKELQARMPSGASPADQARMLNILSRVELYLALVSRGTKDASLALEIAREADDKIGQAEAHLNLALSSIVEGRMDVLNTSTAASVELLEGVDRPELLGEAMLRMAMLYQRRGQLEESIRMSMQAMEIAKRSNDPLSQAYAHQGLAVAFAQTEHYENAYEHYVRMREMARAVPSKMLEGYALLGLGIIMDKLGDQSTGEANIRESIRLFREMATPFALNHATYTLADLFRSHGRHLDALQLFSTIVEVYERYPNKIGLWYALVARSGEFLILGNRQAAMTDAERAYEIAKGIGFSLYLTESAQQIAALYAAKGDFRAAYDLSREAASQIARSSREKMSERVLEMTQRYEIESRRRHIEELTRRNEQQQAELRQRALQERFMWTLLWGGFGILVGTFFFLLRLRRSHRIIRELNLNLEQRVQTRTAELRQQTQYLRTLIDALPWWVWLKDTEGRYRAVNLAAAQKTRYSTDELVGKSDFDLLSPDVAKAFLSDDVEVMSTRKQKIVEEPQQTVDGTIWMETFKAPVLDVDGTVLGTVGFARDISERKAMEAQREAALAEAQRLVRLRSDLLAQISHELRTPLNGILGYAQILLLDHKMDERQKSGIKVIQQSGEHLLTLINDILDSAKIDAGRLDLYPSDISLPQFLNTIAEMITVKADQKGIQFVLDAAPNLPAAAHVDGKRLRQVLLNLLSNAIKFTDHGTVSLRVGFSAPSRWRFEVEDTGIGIDAEQMAEIFQPFAQTGEIQRRLGGTGLGLAISRQFVRLMGGDIEVESRVGEGSRFWFELDLPLVQAAPDASNSEPAFIGYEGVRRTILIVDDIAENRSVARDMLSRFGFVVHEAASGVEALDLAPALSPDIILMDVVMPEMDGLETTQKLQAIPSLADIPVIAMSASAPDEERQRNLGTKLDAFLSKPLVMKDLMEKIGSLLKLTWIYDSTMVVGIQRDTALSSSFEIPPREEMEVLHRLARIGNMDDIIACAKHISGLDDRYHSFASYVSNLAKGFQSKAILKFVKDCLEKQVPA